MGKAFEQSTASDPADRPVMLRIETMAGHGAGKPVRKVVAEQADILTFLAWQLELG